MWVNGVGAVATAITLVVVVVSKLAEGAWIAIIVVPLLVLTFWRISKPLRERREGGRLRAPALARGSEVADRHRPRPVVEQAHEPRAALRARAVRPTSARFTF